MSACVVNVAVSVGSWGSWLKIWSAQEMLVLKVLRYTTAVQNYNHQHTFVHVWYWSINANATSFPFGWTVGHLKCLFKWFLQCSWLFQRFICLGVHWRCWITSPSTVTLLLDDCCISVQTHNCPFAFVRPVFKGPAMDLLTFLLHLFLRVCFPCRYLSLSVVYPIKCVMIIFALLLEMISREK